MMYGTNIVLYIFPVPSFKIFFINSIMSSDSHKNIEQSLCLLWSIFLHVNLCTWKYWGLNFKSGFRVYLVYKYTKRIYLIALSLHFQFYLNGYYKAEYASMFKLSPQLLLVHIIMHPWCSCWILTLVCPFHSDG